MSAMHECCIVNFFLYKLHFIFFLGICNIFMTHNFYCCWEHENLYRF